MSAPDGPGATAPLLRFAGVCVQAALQPLLRDVNLQLPPAGLFGLVGPNGAGKSTLVRAALGLQPPARGEIHLLGRELRHWKPRALAAVVGYVPQHIHSHWDLTVQELLQLALAPASPQLLDDFELRPLLGRRLRTLSGGEQARAAIARAMAHRPALLLADEPAAHLDLPHQHALMRLLQRCARHSSVLIVLHDLHLAARYCDTVAMLAQGRLVRTGPPAEVLDDLTLGCAYAGPLQRVTAQGLSFFTVAAAQRCG